jgi:nitrite reductase/ring-hydroxylating ferredoxin subunit
MERKEFLKNCGYACLGASMLSVFLESCNSSRQVEGTILNADLVVPLSSFRHHKDSFRKYIIVDHEKLKYPICVYRFSENHYSALLMRCTHQGTELQVFGERLQCPAHGSEFSNTGIVHNGPADTNLRTFPVILQNDQLYISLK